MNTINLDYSNDLTLPPKVSVCVTTYNQQEYIVECLESIFDQECAFPFEVIIGDDNSTDNTSSLIEQIIESQSVEVRYSRHIKNIGPYKNYRFVHAAARGEYVAHIDGDDKFLPGKLSIQVAFMEKHPECVISGHNVHTIDQYGAISYRPKTAPAISPIDELILRGNYLCHSSTIYRRETVLSDYLDPEAIDFQMYVDRVRGGMIGFIDTPLGEYRVNPNGMVLSLYGRSTAMFQKNLSAIRASEPYCRKSNSVNLAIYKLIKRWIRNFLAAGRLDLAEEAFRFIEGSELTWSQRVFIHTLLNTSPAIRALTLAKRRLFKTC